MYIYPYICIYMYIYREWGWRRKSFIVSVTVIKTVIIIVLYTTERRTAFGAFCQCGCCEVTPRREEEKEKEIISMLNIKNCFNRLPDLFGP